MNPKEKIKNNTIKKALSSDKTFFRGLKTAHYSYFPLYTKNFIQFPGKFLRILYPASLPFVFFSVKKINLQKIFHKTDFHSIGKPDVNIGQRLILFPFCNRSIFHFPKQSRNLLPTLFGKRLELHIGRYKVLSGNSLFLQLLQTVAVSLSHFFRTCGLESSFCRLLRLQITRHPEK